MHPKFYLVCFFLTLILLASTFPLYSPQPAIPACCALCQADQYQGPCVLDLTTGNIFELAVFEPHETLAAEPSDEQHADILCLHMQNRLSSTSCPGEGWCVSTLPMKKERPDASRFCEACGTLLRPYYRNGYVLLDLYGEPACFALRPGQTHILRDYTVTVSAEGENVRVHVASSRFGGNGVSPI